MKNWNWDLPGVLIDSMMQRLERGAEVNQQESRRRAFRQREPQVQSSGGRGMPGVPL